MDGSPIKKEVVPVRMYLGQFDLTPTYKTIDGTASVRYFLDLGLYDEDDRRYFKQHEIYLWRDRDENMLDKNQTNFITPYFEKLRADLQKEEDEAARREERKRKRMEERKKKEEEEGGGAKEEEDDDEKKKEDEEEKKRKEEEKKKREEEERKRKEEEEERKRKEEEERKRKEEEEEEERRLKADVDPLHDI